MCIRDSFQIGREAQQQDFALILEDDLAAAEEDVRFHFGALFQEIFRMLELEVVVVIVRVRPETDFLDYHLDDLRLEDVYKRQALSCADRASRGFFRSGRDRAEVRYVSNYSTQVSKNKTCKK